MRQTAIFVLFVTLTLSAAAPKKQPAATIAPADIPHSIAQFLRSLSKDGGRAVTFKASASGTRFFFEEPGGVTVYRYVNGKYVKETFLAGKKLPAVVKQYAKK
ncbi:MAG TPA: hypothetical protein VFV49_16265 [Thermoanaerobaculia bacterium]|nr:hypothetical protein [Thermoanaerobaculia bacterium]